MGDASTSVARMGEVLRWDLTNADTLLASYLGIVQVEFSTEAQTRVLFRCALCKLSQQLCTVVAWLLQNRFGAEWKMQSAKSLKDKKSLVERIDRIDDGTLDLYYVFEILKHFHSEFATEFCSSGGLHNFKATYTRVLPLHTRTC